MTAPLTAARRFEAVVLVGDGTVDPSATIERVSELCDAGLALGFVGSRPGELADELGGLSTDGCVVAPPEVAASGDSEALRWTVAELERWGIPPTAVLVVAGGRVDDRRRADGLPDVHGVTFVVDDDPARILEDQLRLRRAGALPAVVPDPGWALILDGFDPARERVHEVLCSLADGRIGTSGAPLAWHAGVRRWVLAEGVYDGEGPPTHLLTAPVAVSLPYTLDEEEPELRRVLDLRTGLLHEEAATAAGRLESVRFASMARPGTVAIRAACPDRTDPADPLLPPMDDRPLDEGRAGDVAWMRVAASVGGIAAAARDLRYSGPAGEIVDRVAVYAGDPERVPEPDEALARLGEASTLGFDRLLGEHRRAWAERWDDADIVLVGDDELQHAARFTLFHLMASVADEGEAAVGARAVSGTAYRGHVFWDADTFTLPFFAATHPAAARAMLEYRLRRLPAALSAARRLGRAGARFPWESARSGRDVTPPSVRDRTGRVVPIRTGLLEEHIVAEVPWAARCYVDWTGDEEFAAGPGRLLLIETARYWASRIRVGRDGAAHLYGVIGPDEYHEPVDDNAFTNVMARWNLRAAVEAASEGDGVAPGEVERWHELADALVDGFDADTGIYEQFAGFYGLEPLIIEEVAPRRPIAADLLLGAARVHGAQVVKQADVLMLYHLVPDEVEPGTLEPNLRYYEPRTAHGSSLSPSIHASLFARARNYPKAMEALGIASKIDLADLTESTAGGLHIATMGGLWQAYAYGFAGLRPRAGRLHVDPRLPPSWAALELRVRFRGSRVRIRLEPGEVQVSAERPVPVAVGDALDSPGPGGSTFRRQRNRWELA